ncbi:serine--tRNA synthetase-like protein Slimp isoform X2 [Tubulanus polymorphus]|uniref:serine--tRNA synthetase-like protein Slimp isoform X2 n=1 Tax=Tubulanus polymorphus TaxID=672921 RepID=UPI003DA31A54
MSASAFLNLRPSASCRWLPHHLLRTRCLQLQQQPHLQSRYKSSTSNSASRPSPSPYEAKSALFVSNEIAQATLSSNLQLDLGLENRINELETLERNVKRRKLTIDLVSFEKSYRNYCELNSKLNKLNENRKTVAKKMGELKKDKMNVEVKKKLIAKGKSLKEQHKLLSKEYWEIEEKVMLTALNLPNVLSKNSPDTDEVIRNFGDDFISHQTSVCLNHAELCEERNLLKFCKFSPGGYYMRGELAVMELSILELMRNEMDNHSFTSMICPNMFRTLVIEASGHKLSDPKDVFILESKNADLSSKYENLFHLCGASLSSFSAYLTKMSLRKEQLPMRAYTQGRSYSPDEDLNKESLINVQQESTIHVCVACETGEETDSEFEQLVEKMWNIYTKFQLPIRLVNVSAQNLRSCEYERRNIDVWIPSINSYITIAYLANYRDFISRRLTITSSPNKLHLNIIHGKLVSVPKLLAAIIENYEQIDPKKLQIPEVLNRSSLNS